MGGISLRGRALAERGHGAEGHGQFREGLAAHRAIGAETGQSLFLALLGEAYGEDDQVEEGPRTVVEALSHAERTEEHWYEAELYRLRGELLLQQSPDNATEAEACFHKALEVSRRQKANP